MATKATQIKRGNDILHPETDTRYVVGLADWDKGYQAYVDSLVGNIY